MPGIRHLSSATRAHMKSPRGKAKVAKVMREFKKGTLRSSSGHRVTSRDQAIAIAMSEAGLSRKKRN